MSKIVAVGDAASDVVSSMKYLICDEDYMLLKQDNLKDKEHCLKGDLKKFIGKSNEVMLIVCLGGKTGSHFSPKIVSMLNEFNVKVYVVAQLPFSFEGRTRNETALKAFYLLEKKAHNFNMLYGQKTLENNRGSGLTLQEAFDLLDKRLINNIKEVMITKQNK